MSIWFSPQATVSAAINSAVDSSTNCSEATLQLFNRSGCDTQSDQCSLKRDDRLCRQVEGCKNLSELGLLWIC